MTTSAIGYIIRVTMPRVESPKPALIPFSEMIEQGKRILTKREGIIQSRELKRELIDGVNKARRRLTRELLDIPMIGSNESVCFQDENYDWIVQTSSPNPSAKTGDFYRNLTMLVYRQPKGKDVNISTSEMQWAVTKGLSHFRTDRNGEFYLLTPEGIACLTKDLYEPEPFWYTLAAGLFGQPPLDIPTINQVRVANKIGRVIEDLKKSPEPKAQLQVTAA